MKKVLAFTVLVGCGDALPDNDFDYGCRSHSDGYSHSVILCGGQEPENVEDIFVTCNIRKSRQEQFEGCIGSTDLMDLDPDCELLHVCLEDQ